MFPMFLMFLKMGSQYDTCASIMTGSAIETSGRMYMYIRIEIFSNLTYAYIIPFVSTALPVHIENPP